MSGSVLDTLAGFDRQAALDAGIEPGKVRDWAKLYDVYVAPTTAHRQQARAVDLVRRGTFSLDQLALIERRLDAVGARERTRTRLDVLEELAAARPGSYQSFARMLKRLVPVEQVAPSDGASFSRSRMGKRTVTVTADERDIADLEHAVTRGIDPDRPAGPQLAANFVRIMRGDGSQAGVPCAAPQPLVLVPAPELAKVLNDEADPNEVRFGLTDGTTITGAEYLARYFSNPAYGVRVAVFHAEDGAVNLYRGERCANEKQRVLARAANPVCPVPDCRHGADSCEAHHIVAWKHGGETNMRNLAMLCRYHNRTNDDDTHRKRRGRIENVRGAPTWVSPRGYAVPNNYHPYGAMQTLFGR